MTHPIELAKPMRLNVNWNDTSEWSQCNTLSMRKWGMTVPKWACALISRSSRQAVPIHTNFRGREPARADCNVSVWCCQQL